MKVTPYSSSPCSFPLCTDRLNPMTTKFFRVLTRVFLPDIRCWVWYWCWLWAATTHLPSPSRLRRRQVVIPGITPPCPSSTPTLAGAGQSGGAEPAATPTPAARPDADADTAAYALPHQGAGCCASTADKHTNTRAGNYGSGISDALPGGSKPIAHLHAHACGRSSTNRDRCAHRYQRHRYHF